MKLTLGDLRKLIREKYQRETPEEFQARWEGKDVFVRFEQPHPGIPVTINRDSTYGDVWGVWGFYLKYPWPTHPDFLTKMRDVYVYKVKPGSVIMDNKFYTDADYARDEKLLRKFYGDKVDNAQQRYDTELSQWSMHSDTEHSEISPAEMPPAKRIFEVISRLTESTKKTNFVFRKLGYDVIIDSSREINEHVYAPSVGVVVLDPTKIVILDSYTRKNPNKIEPATIT